MIWVSRRRYRTLTPVQDNYGRAKETHAHTQALWEKEIRRARKENFKSQSTIVKLQEELKTARTAVKISEECLEREKERSKTREQEAFSARYQMVGIQEQLDKALERVKVVEQERDAFKTAAKNEEVARIAAEGRLPLPIADDPEEECEVPKKVQKKRKRDSAKDAPRISLSTMEIVSSAASEMEIEELTTQVMWERQRAERAQEMIEFLQAECQMNCCPCSKDKHQASVSSKQSPQMNAQPLPELEQSTTDTVDNDAAKGSVTAVSVEMNAHVAAEPEVEEGDDDVMVPDLSMEAPSVEEPEQELEANEEPKPHQDIEIEELAESTSEPGLAPLRSKKERRSTIFCQKEGVFRTVSEQEAAALEGGEEVNEPQQTEDDDMDIILPDSIQYRQSSRMYARTPSVEPPSCAIIHRGRTSLQSLLNAPHSEDEPTIPTTFNIPTVDDDVAVTGTEEVDEIACQTPPSPEHPLKSSTTRYTVTTTKVPVRDDAIDHGSSFSEKLRTPSNGSATSFDLNDPALTPTMTREEALAKIRERRGRARSNTRQPAVATSTATAATPHKKAAATGKRDLSAPTGRTASRPTSRTVSKTTSRPTSRTK